MIYTSSMISSFAGFFILYNTSRKAKLSHTGKFERWIQLNPVPARITGLLLLLVSFVILIAKMGTGVGILTSFALLMTAASIIVSIAPLQYFRLQHIILLVAGTFLLEFLFL